MPAFDVSSASVSSLVLAVLIFQAIPGPGTFAILRATANHGLKAGFACVAGTILGGLVCMLAAVSGLEAVFRGQPEAVHALRCGGALYLAWMGWRLFDQRRRAAAPAESPVAPPLWHHLRQALAVSLTNPKVLLFYFALLPLFVRPPVTPMSLATVALCVCGVSLAWQGGLVLAGNAVARSLGALPSAQRIARQLAGLLFIGFAVKLLVA